MITLGSSMKVGNSTNHVAPAPISVQALAPKIKKKGASNYINVNRENRELRAKPSSPLPLPLPRFAY